MNPKSLHHAFVLLVSRGEEVVLTAGTNLEIKLDAPLAVSTGTVKSLSPAPGTGKRG